MSAATVARRTAAALLVAGIVGIVVVAYWRGSNATPDAGDIVLYLVALPVALVGGYWLLRWRLGARASQAATQTTAATGVDAPGAAPQVDRVLHLLASAILVPAGANAAEVVAALAEPKRPALHPGFKDEAGLPVFAAPVDGIDADAFAETLRDGFDQRGQADGLDIDALFAPEHLRALALLDPVAEQLLHAALPRWAQDVDPYAAPAIATTPASVLRVRLLLPAPWSAAAQQAAADWLQAKAEAVGHRADAIAIEALPVMAAADVWRLLDEVARLPAREPRLTLRRDLHLLIGAHSLIGEASIADLSQRGQLLGSGRPEGRVPGEGAAGVLLAAPGIDIDADADADVEPGAPAPLRVHRQNHAQALTGVSSRRMVQHAGELIARALATAAQPADTIVALLSDGDHRPSRAVELAGAMSMVLPELDPIAHGLHLGVACGDLGAVAPLALLAIAAAQAELTAAPVVAISVADDALRVALAVSPLPLPVNGAPAPAGATNPSPAPAPALAQPA